MSDELLDMTAIARTISRARVPIAIGLIAGAIIGALASLYLVPYRSEAIYTIGVIRTASGQPGEPGTPQDPNSLGVGWGMSVEAFKIAYSMLDREGFRRYLEHRHDEDARGAAEIARILASPDARSLALVPIYATTRADLRQLGDSSGPKENSAIAVQVTIGDKKPDEATRKAAIVGDFIGETIFAAQADGLIRNRLEKYETARIASENRLLDENFQIGTTGQKIARLQELRREVAGSHIADARQIVSVGDGGAHYLPPVTQLVGAESSLADLRERIAQEGRKRDVATLLVAYYRNAQRAIAEAGDSESLLAKLSSLLTGSLVQGATESELSEARNVASLDLNALRVLRTRYLRFASGPTEGWRDPNRVWKYSAAGAVIGALLVALIAVGRRVVS